MATIAVSKSGGGPRGGARVIATGLFTTFGSTVALRGVDAKLEAGRLTLIEGANGSGKSTLLGILGTVSRPTGGSVRYERADGAELTDSWDVRAALGWVSHETLAYGDLTGRQNIELAAALYGVGEGAWERVRDRFELGAFAERPLRTNSRGQRQRVALARALAHRPSVVLLDEPTAGLDRQGVERLLAVIDEEVSGGAVVAVVSHEPELFRERVGARLVLERGKVKAVS